jgi:hypothetical protein
MGVGAAFLSQRRVTGELESSNRAKSSASSDQARLEAQVASLSTQLTVRCCLSHGPRRDLYIGVRCIHAASVPVNVPSFMQAMSKELSVSALRGASTGSWDSHGSPMRGSTRDAEASGGLPLSLFAVADAAIARSQGALEFSQQLRELRSGFEAALDQHVSYAHQRLAVCIHKGAHR